MRARDEKQHRNLSRRLNGQVWTFVIRRISNLRTIGAPDVLLIKDPNTHVIPGAVELNINVMLVNKYVNLYYVRYKQST